jgi:hypothetical protein
MYVKEVNGTNYLIFINQKEEASVHTLEENGVMRHVNTRQLSGVNSFSSFIHDKYIIYSSVSGFRMYNFTDNTEGGITATSNDGLVSVRNLWHMDQGDVMFQGKYNNAGPVRYFYMSSSYRFEHLPELFEGHYLKNQRIFCSKQNDQTKDYFLFRPDNEKLFYLFGGTNKNHGVYIDDTVAWYLDEEMSLINFHLVTQKKNFKGIQSSYNSEYNRIVIQNENLVIFHGSEDSLITEVFHLKTNNKKYEFRHQLKGIIDHRNFFVLDSQYILFRTDTGIIGSINTKTGNLVQYQGDKNYQFYDWPIIKNRYTVFPDQKRIVVFDVKSGFSFFSDEQNKSFQSWSPGMIEYDNNFYVSFFHKDKSLPQLFKISLSDFTVETSSLLTEVNTGLNRKAQLLKAGNDIIAAAQKVYLLQGNTSTAIEGLTTSDVNQTYSIGENTWYYTQSTTDSTHIYEARGIERFPIASMEKTSTKLLHWGVTSKFLYYYDHSKQLYKLNRNETQAVRIPGFQNPTHFNCFAHNDIFFAFKVDNLVALTDTDTSFMVLEKVDPAKCQWFTLSGRLYVRHIQKIYIWEGDRFVLVADQISANSSSHYNKDENKYILWDIIKKQGIILTSDSVRVITTDIESPSPLVFINSFEQLYFFSDKWANHQVYDAHKSEWYRLPESIIQKNPLGLFMFENDTLLILHDPDKIYTIKLSKSFTLEEERYVFHVNGGILQGKLSVSNGFGLLQTDKNIFYFNNKGKFFEITDLNSSPETGFQTLMTDEGDLNFFAINSLWGRQVYIISKDPTKEEMPPDPEETPLVLYPNPATDFITWKGLTSETIEYYIIDAAGRLIEYHKTGPKVVNISRLSSGVYYIKLVVKDQSSFFPFVKQ